MYISNIAIKNYRNFNSLTVNFKDGINLLIGQNNSGKSNLLRALSLIFDPSSKKQLEVDDICNSISIESLKEHSPKVIICVSLSQSDNEDLMGDELVTVSNWLTSLNEPYIAKIQYEFFLPQSEELNYLKDVENISSSHDIWEIIRNKYIRYYVYKIWVGNSENQITVDRENLNKFDFQFLDAIRDVERDMFSGRNPLLKSIIGFFIDYDIKSNDSISGSEQEKEITKKRVDFEKDAKVLVTKLKSRLESGNKEILTYSDDIGASFDNLVPDFEGKLSESELFSILKLVVRQNAGLNIPIANNGLGYNNLIFMSLLLAKMQVDSDGSYLGSNAKVFPILAIEEPEAHLHPTMQFQLVKFLKKNINDDKVKQVFITSHSTHITSSSNLDEIICFYKEKVTTKVSYPGEVFNNDNSKKYVQRFLDATKSNMLFAEKIIFVEGIAEQLLIPIFAEYLNKPLEENHISVINIGGRYFDHFLQLFDSNTKKTINRKIACITDIDPTRKKEKNSKFKSCYPYEYNLDPTNYQYRINNNLDKYKDNNHPNIRVFIPNENYGKTFEYQLAFENGTNKLLLTTSIKNKTELEKIIDLIKGDKPTEEVLNNLKVTNENERIKKSIRKVDNPLWSDKKKNKAIFASLYLNSASKGQNALELSVTLKENLEQGSINKFEVPSYIKKAIEWITED